MAMTSVDMLQFIKQKFILANCIDTFLMSANTILKELYKGVNENEEIMSYVIPSLNALMMALNINRNDFIKCKSYVHGLPVIKFYGDNTNPSNLNKFATSLKQNVKNAKDVIDYSLSDNYYHSKLKELNEQAQDKANIEALVNSTIAKADANAKEIESASFII